MIRRTPRSTQSRSSAASDVYKRQGQRAVVVVEADRAGVLLDLAAVELRPAVVAHQDGGDAGLHAAGRELGDLGLDLFAYLFGDRLAVDDLSCHGVPLVSRRGLVRAWRA